VQVTVVHGCPAAGCCFGVHLCACVWCVGTCSPREVGGCTLLLFSWWRLYTSRTCTSLSGKAHQAWQAPTLCAAPPLLPQVVVDLQGRPLGTACVFRRAASGLCAL
jgi:hypothetical protein